MNDPANCVEFEESKKIFDILLIYLDVRVLQIVAYNHFLRVKEARRSTRSGSIGYSKFPFVFNYFNCFNYLIFYYLRRFFFVKEARRSTRSRLSFISNYFNFFNYLMFDYLCRFLCIKERRGTCTRII